MSILEINNETKIKIGRYAAIIAIPIVLCIPILMVQLVCFLLPEVSWSRIMEEGESRDFTGTYIIGGAIFHLPLCVFLYFFFHDLNKNRVGKVHLFYCLVLLGFFLSTCCYMLLYSQSNCRWLMFVHALFYFILLIPLAIGLYGSLKRDEKER